MKRLLLLFYFVSGACFSQLTSGDVKLQPELLDLGSLLEMEGKLYEMYKTSSPQLDSVFGSEASTSNLYKYYDAAAQVALQGENPYEFEPIPNALRTVFDRQYVTGQGIESYRENLDQLMGRIVKNGVILPIWFVKKGAQIEQFAPKDGKLTSFKLTEKSSQVLTFFIGGSVTKEKIIEFSVADIERAVLGRDDMDNEALKRYVVSTSSEDLKKQYVITAATVTEIYRREYRMNKKTLKAGNFPGTANAISFEGSFFISDENFEREYKIGLTITKLDMLKEYFDSLAMNDSK